MWPVLQGIGRQNLFGKGIYSWQTLFKKKETKSSIKSKHKNDCPEWEILLQYQHVGITLTDIPHSSPHKVS